MIKNKIVVIFSGFYLPHLGGVERYTAGLISELKKDYKVVLVTSNVFNQSEYEKIDDVEIYRLDVFKILKDRFPILKHNSKNKRIIEKIEALEISNIICNTRYYGTTFLGLRIAKDKNLIPIIIDHSSDFVFEPYEKWGLKKIKKYSPKFYTVSGRSEEWLKKLGIKSEGVFYNSVVSQKDFVKKHAKQIRLVYAGRVMKEKGLDYIVNSYNELKDKYDISLEIIGDGPILRDLKKHEDIIFSGQIEHGEVLKRFRGADIFVYPTLYPEGFPTVILEAAMNKCVIVATDRGGTRELISDDDVGIILDKPEDLTIKLEELIKDEKRLRRIQENVFKKVNEKFTWSKTAKVIKKELERYE